MRGGAGNLACPDFTCFHFIDATPCNKKSISHFRRIQRGCVGKDGLATEASEPRKLVSTCQNGACSGLADAVLAVLYSAKQGEACLHSCCAYHEGLPRKCVLTEF